MPVTYESIASQTLSSAAASITFSSIPATFTDLRVTIVNIGGTGGCRIQFNGDTATNYSRRALMGEGVNAVSDSAINSDRISLEYYGMSATIPTLYTADVFSYSGSTYKTLLGTASEDFNGSGSSSVRVGLWRSTAAITSLTLFTIGTAFQSGTTAKLIGIKNA